MKPRTEAPIQSVTARVYTIPTETPESDGTITWDHTTLLIVEVEAGGMTGLGYSYSAKAAAQMVTEVLGPEIEGSDALAIEKAWSAMNAIVRNIGRPGIAATAISAVDIALWDLKAKLFGVSLTDLLPRARDSVAVYGSGGFTSYDRARLCDQLAGWAEEGCCWVKMKVGRAPAQDPERVAAARKAIGDTGLFVDANGAYEKKQALGLAEAFVQSGVCWFEEPVSSDDLEGLAFIRRHAPAQTEIAAGEYGYTPYYFQAMLAAGAVDTLQADATRCGGVTGFLRASALCDSFQVPLSSHCAPSAHLAVALAAPRLKHMEWFFDHVRIEQMLLDGCPRIQQGRLTPDLGATGHGLVLRVRDAARFEA